ncbi:hypothetical protein SLG_25370 [Sphingobium sp. SYK-6]|uniref:exosortase A n=1 Tax=Sphingobium sp. (strain NBRC 103272 / SYK-6) TaxID=627192 RepID=UPI000227760E|nr:EpsI domain-containing exosortase [Sphingobium sp. SYK-6]BAK67212.1 hypothetical protein SLG_25370 [Sphingobium sp. SYK-6]
MNMRPAFQHMRAPQVIRQSGEWRAALVRLAVLGVLFALLFHADIIDMVQVWLRSSSYGHCVFLPFIIGWLVRQRVPALRQLEAVGWWPALAWLGLGAFAWLLGWAGGVALFRHAALVVMAQGIVLTVLGPAVGRALAFPLFYALFMIPFGTEAEPVLQILTARMAIGLLWLAGVPAEISGIFITTPNAYFRVAEACSGTGFLIAMAAFSTLVAHLCFRSTLRRLLFVAGALAICLLANGVRAFGIMLVAYHSSVDAAVVVDHVFYGWLFFALVLVLVLVAGRPFFDRAPSDPWFDPARLQGAAGAPRASAAILPAAALAMLAPVGWASASSALSTALPPVTTPPQVAGWTQERLPLLPRWDPHYRGADRIVMTHYRDGADRVVDLALVFFAWQEDGKELVGFGQGAVAPEDEGGDWAWESPARAPDRARGDMLAGPKPQRRLVHTYYRVGGQLTGQAGRVKLETLKARLLGRDQRAMAILLSTPVPPGPQGEAQAQRALADFTKALGPIEDLADRSLAIR